MSFAFEFREAFIIFGVKPKSELACVFGRHSVSFHQNDNIAIKKRLQMLLPLVALLP